MTTRILKWPVPIDDLPHLIGNGPVALVAMQPGTHDMVCIWTVEQVVGPDGTTEPPGRPVQVFGTGERIESQWPSHVGSAVDEPFVWHVMSAYGGQR